MNRGFISYVTKKKTTATLRCEGTKIWRREISNKRFQNIDAEIDIRRIKGCQNKEEWQKIGIYIINSKERWERILRRNDSEAELNLD
jgi:hypothetical protein